jgi:hypothetical protein
MVAKGVVEGVHDAGNRGIMPMSKTGVRTGRFSALIFLNQQ